MKVSYVLSVNPAHSIRPITKVSTRYTTGSGSGMQDT